MNMMLSFLFFLALWIGLSVSMVEPVLHALVSPFVHAAPGNAVITHFNPADVYNATFNASTTKSGIHGFVGGVAPLDGTGIRFHVEIAGFDLATGPFTYHIHTDPVPADGNCTGALGHLDPYQRGENPACDFKHPETCQIGDLSGKHGRIGNQPFTADYLDLYLGSIDHENVFFGNRSVVIHNAKKTRIACANFVLTKPASGAVSRGFSAGVMLIGLVAFFFLLL